MTRAVDPAGVDVEAFLLADERKGLLRFITCGSVDDGKSTLVGRLLYDSKTLFEDQLAALASDSRRVGTRGTELDFALLLDGLSAEREQKITIDVAYRFFATPRRKFIVADTPGHEQYTRNMITGASTADVAVILIDARKGVLTQTRRHTYLAALLGIRHVVLAVNKMDLIDYSREAFSRIEADYRAFASRTPLYDVTCIPIAAVHGHNIARRATETPWYEGPTLIEHLETVHVDHDELSAPFRLPVQWVNRPHPEFRGFAGTIVRGAVHTGDPVWVLPSGVQSRITSVLVGDAEAAGAVAGQSVTVTLGDEIDVSRGNVLAALDAPPQVADQFEATVVWMHERPMLRGRSYILKLATQTVVATVAPLKYKIDVNTLERVAATKLELNDIGVCHLELSEPIVFEPYSDSRDLGGFILIDRITNTTLSADLLHFALRRSTNVRWQSLDIKFHVPHEHLCPHHVLHGESVSSKNVLHVLKALASLFLKGSRKISRGISCALTRNVKVFSCRDSGDIRPDRLGSIRWKDRFQIDRIREANERRSQDERLHTMKDSASTDNVTGSWPQSLKKS
jgi:bifunctional enzyme CysN/CysC